MENNKVLVIPDVHLKPWMFDLAAEIMRESGIENAVCLGDLADDWNQETNKKLYEETYDAAMAFACKFPKSLFCYGNHDISYVYGRLESGYSPYAEGTVVRKLGEMKEAIGSRLAFVHRIGKCVFSHAGLSVWFVLHDCPCARGIDEIVEACNAAVPSAMWRDVSPIWVRPLPDKARMYDLADIIQVTGHTPVKEIRQDKNIISCDVFSTYRDGEKIGTEEFLIIDAVSGEWYGVK